MDWKYFVSKVKPLKCLNDKDMNDIWSFYQYNGGYCGRFNVKKRGQKWISRAPKTTPPRFFPNYILSNSSQSSTSGSTVDMNVTYQLSGLL